MKAKVESAKEIANLLSDEILKVCNAGNKVKRSGVFRKIKRSLKL
jgi:hypothetical protein